MRTRSLWIVLFAAVAAACAADETPGLSGPDDIYPEIGEAAGAAVEDGDAKADALNQTATYYAVKPDLRKCAWPACGGWMVSRVNRAWTLCHDGVWRNACYVVDFDLARDLGLATDDADGLEAGMRAEEVLVRGRLQAKVYAGKRLGHFKTTEAWRAASGARPSGTFYKVTDKQLVCVFQPCPSLHEAQLNSTVSRDIHALEMASTDPAQGEGLLNTAYVAMEQGPVIISGTNNTFVAPLSGQQGTSLDGNQLYVRVRPLAAYAPTARELGGREFHDAASGKPPYPRTYRFEHATWTVRVEDAVAPCAPGATCIWSGIVSREATWSLSGDRVTLSYSGDGANSFGIVYYTTLWVKKDSLGNLVLVEVADDGQATARRFM
ncbi:MAG TPA: DUF6748 domain-containing protein [Pyrinomonadaceae bacterium]